MRSEKDSRLRFRRVFDGYYDEVLRYCLRRLPVADANDAVVEVYVVAWRKIDQLPGGEQARPWLYGVARNVVRNAQRASRRQRRLKAKLDGLASQSAPGVDSVIVRNEESRLLLAALSKLSSDDQEVLRLRAYEGLDSTQIAVALGCSEVAARKRISRAVSRLRKASGLADAKNVAGSRAMDGGGDL